MINTMLLRKATLAALFLWSLNSWALPADIQAAKDEGMRLYNIGQSTTAMTYLSQAANAGDVESMYYMGEAERRQHMLGFTNEAMGWYLQAAEQGDPYSMLRLFNGGACLISDRCPEEGDDWREAALDVTLPKAEAGDPEAMLALHYIYNTLNHEWWDVIFNWLGMPTGSNKWLERAAEAGLPEAQTTLGNHIMNRKGWYFTKSRRLTAAEKWTERAVEQGYVPAIERMEIIKRKQEDFEESWQWMERASREGSVSNRLGLGWCYLDPSYSPDGRCVNEADPIQGWAILYSLKAELEDNSAKNIMSRNSDKLTEAERREAEALAEEEWVDREPPLSKFPPRFGY
ncbi:tetratricopeptide repeat protein [Vreelandella sp. EE27]